MNGRDYFIKSRFVPTMAFAVENDDLSSTVCVYNYFSEIFPDIKTGAELNIWAFSADGECVGHYMRGLPYMGQAQVPVREITPHLFGMVGVSLIPETSPDVRHDAVGTGYYMQYVNARGFVDQSHEWDPMRFRKTKSNAWICVVRPDYGDTSLVVMNSYFGENLSEGQSNFSIRIRSHSGEILEEKEQITVLPRGTWSSRITDVFQSLGQNALREGVAIEVQGDNIMGPFSITTVAGGDFNIHHFC